MDEEIERLRGNLDELENQWRMEEKDYGAKL